MALSGSNTEINSGEILEKLVSRVINSIRSEFPERTYLGTHTITLV